MKDKNGLEIMQTCKNCKIRDHNLCNGQYAIKGSELLHCPAFIKSGTPGVIPRELNVRFPIKQKKGMKR